MNIEPIRTAADHAKALKEIERLWDAKPGTREHDRLDVLATLVDAYERKNAPIGPPDPIDAVLFALEQRGLTRKDLEKFLGSRGRVSEVLGHVRPLSIAMIRALHRELRVPLEVLVIESKAGPIARTKAARKSAARAGARR